MSFIQLANERYSVRKYREVKIEEEKLEMILDAARIAPTAHNSQPQRIKVLTSDEELSIVDECTPCRFGSPLVFLICYDKDVSWKRVFDKADSGEVDASIVTTHMMFAAQELKLNSCWVMFFDPIKTRKLFSLPVNLEPVAFLVVGYAADDAVPSDSHSKRNTIDEMLI